MKFVAPFAFLFVAVGLVEASQNHHVGISRLSGSHHNHFKGRHDVVGAVTRRDDASGSKRRCKAKPSPSSSPAPLPTETPAEPAPTQAPAKANNAKSETKNEAPKDTPKENDFSPVAAASGLIRVVSNICGQSGATDKITATSGPNGQIDWLNCGLNGGGWNPPQVSVQDLVVKDLAQSLKEPNSPFKPCEPFLGLFEQHARSNGIEPIMIASIAMQESGCKPNVVGGAGEQGLMQITKDKCGEAPGGNCQDPDYNIRKGTEFFASTLKANGGNVLLAVGKYNGWHLDLTFLDAILQRLVARCQPLQFEARQVLQPRQVPLSTSHCLSFTH
ncbi:unnamed protein product [Somion occarium]|uniref:Transglycosylase SLT domain-containing protein n=1 Tax=Somion occarium TaxID=3059160 RepID=A0ABP1DHQ0_9APHY